MLGFCVLSAYILQTSLKNLFQRQAFLGFAYKNSRW